MLKSKTFAKFAVRNNNTNDVQYITPPIKRIWFYVLKMLAFCSRMISTDLYLKMLVSAHKSQGVKFVGKPEYIQLDSYLDPSGGLTISEGVVISTRVIILSHDWSWLKRVGNIEKYASRGAYSPVLIGPHTFIGAGVIILPGTTTGRNCIIGAGAVVKGSIPDYSIVIGNPATIIGTTTFV